MTSIGSFASVLQNFKRPKGLNLPSNDCLTVNIAGSKGLQVF
jgi:hypothetical protein